MKTLNQNNQFVKIPAKDFQKLIKYYNTDNLKNDKSFTSKALVNKNFASKALVNKSFATGGKITDANGRAIVNKYPLGGINPNETNINSTVSGATTGMSIGAMFGGVGAPVGAAVGAIGGYAMGSIQNNKQKKLLKEQEIEDAKLRKEIENNENVARASIFNSDGFINRSMYAMGGVKPIASNMGKAIGDTHEQDTDNDGQTGIPFKGAEIENGEVTYSLPDKDLIFSNRLLTEDGHTFAQIATMLGAEKGRIEKQMSNRSGTESKGTNERIKEKIAMLDKQVMQLFEEQEALKNPQQQEEMQEGHQAAYGGYLRKFFEGGIHDNDDNVSMKGDNKMKGLLELKRMKLDEIASIKNLPMEKMKPLPTPVLNVDSNLQLKQQQQKVEEPFKKSFSDNSNKVMNVISNGLALVPNLYDVFTTNRRPSIPTPLLSKFIPNKIKVNVDSQINSINSGLDTFRRDIVGNTSNSNNAISKIRAGQTDAITMKNKVFEMKENTETGLQNENITRQNANINENISKINNFNNSKFAAKVDIQNQQSENLYGLRNDARTLVKDANLEKADQDKIYFNSLAVRGNSAALYNMYSTFANNAKSRGTVNDLREWIKMYKDQTLIDKFNNDFPKYKI